MLRTGLLDYIAGREPSALLFPMFTPNKYGKLADGASEYAYGWLREVVGIDAGPRVLTFHSCRHIVKTMLRHRVDRDTHDRITGHGDGSVSRDYGGDELVALAEAIGTHVRGAR